MTHPDRIVLILGSAPDAVRARDRRRGNITDIVAISNAWRVRPDWNWHIHPEDFPPENRPQELRPGQRIVSAMEYVPRQNLLGGYVYPCGPMASTAGDWALHALRPRVIAGLGCDMIYSGTGRSLRSLEANSARLMLIAAERGTACVNLSQSASRRDEGVLDRLAALWLDALSAAGHRTGAGS